VEIESTDLVVGEWAVIQAQIGEDLEKFDLWTIAGSTTTAQAVALPVLDSDWFVFAVSAVGATTMIARTTMSVGTFVAGIGISRTVMLFIAANSLCPPTKLLVKNGEQIYCTNSTQGQWVVYCGRVRFQ